MRVIQPINQKKKPMGSARAISLLVAGYVISGKLALLLALPPGYATAFFPPAGISVAVIMIGGTRLLPGVLIGAFILNVILGLGTGGAISHVSLVAATTIAIGSTLQAWAGGSALRRWVNSGLDSSRDVLLFLLLAPVICLICASVAVPIFFLIGIVPSGDMLANWVTWWAGDTIGVLLAAPLTWIYVGQPRRLWWKRRWLLIVPLGLSSVVFIAVYLKASVWEQDQLSQTFRLKSQQVGDVLQYQLAEHERSMRTLASLLNQKDAITAEEFKNMARGYLDQRPDLRSMSWSPRIASDQRAEFEQWAKQKISKDYAIRQVGPDGQWHEAARRAQYYPIVYVEPLQRNEATLGYDKLSDPTGAASLKQAVVSGRPTASEMVALVQPEGGEKGILLSQAIRFVRSTNKDSSIGILSMVVQLEPFLKHATASANFPNLLLRLEDISRGASSQLLVDGIGRPYRTGDFQRTLSFGDRTYQLTVAPTSQYLAINRGWQSWTALVCGLLLIGLLGAFLLLMSGQRAQVEWVVADRTRKLHEREARLQAILNNAADAILTIDHEGKLISANGAAGDLFSYVGDSMQGLSFDQFMKLDEGESSAQVLARLSKLVQANIELTGRKLDGSLFPVEISVSLVEATEEAFYVCILRDLSEQRRSQEQIYQLAHHDPLTGLANRFALNQRLEHLLAMSRRSEAEVAVMFIDLDHFKKINDSMGHQIGDLLLIEVARRLKKLLRDSDIVARPGGDEFVVVLAQFDSVDDVTALAARIIAGLAEVYQLEEHKLHSGASIGISMFPTDGADANTLLRNADAAMYVAKGKGRGIYQFFSSELNAAAHERLQIENQIWVGLERKEFELFLQPQMHLASRRIIGAEALIRWHHPQLGLVQPDRFIPIAEESGLILPLGEWVLERAMHILAGWQNGPFAGLRLAINLSARQCHSGTLINSIDRLQAETGVDLRWLEIEITETAAMFDPEQTRELLRKMRSRGIKVAIDDFGTGYSSLSYLKIFDIDRIKIDRSFVKDIENDQNDALIASATIALAHNLGLEVIAEGVETEAQCAFLNHELCDEGQGYLFGRPMPVADFETLISAELEDASLLRSVTLA